MDDKLKNKMNQVIQNQGFIKVTDAPVTGLTSEQKAILNRKGNVLFNQGDVESARRLFITTGYSDGLTRVGDYYAQNQNKELQALKLYWLAHNKRKSDPIIQKVAILIKTLLNEKE